MSQRDPGVYLEDIEHYAGLAIRFTTALSLEQYLTDAKTRAAVERVLEVCGEALNRPHARISSGFATSSRMVMRSWTTPRSITLRLLMRQHCCVPYRKR
jgi:uncharacterized protein with HEPN domain